MGRMMSRRCAVLGAGHESIHAIDVARDLGYEVIALDGNSQAAGLCLADEAVVIDINDTEAVAEVLKSQHVRFLLPVPIGRAIMSTGALNDRLGLPGVSAGAAERCADKYKFHEILHASGLRKGKCVVLKSMADLDEVDFFPLVLKPRFGSGSRGVRFLASRDELVRERDIAFDGEEYIAESAAPGIELGLDAAITRGTLQVVLLRAKRNTPPPIRQCVGYRALDRGSHQRLYDLVQDKFQLAIQVLDLNDCLLHADILYDGSDLFIIEMSPRPSGHHLSDKFVPLCTGVDMVEEFIKFVEYKPYEFVPTRVKAMEIDYFDLPPGVVEQVPGNEILEVFGESLVEFDCALRVGDVLGPVIDGASLMGRGHMILESRADESLMDIERAIKDGFQIKELNG